MLSYSAALFPRFQTAPRTSLTPFRPMPESETNPLRRSYEFIVNTSGDLLTFLNRDYCYEAANRAYCRAHDLDPAEILGRSVAEVWGKGAFERVIRQNLDRCFSGEIVRDKVWLNYAGLGPRFMDITYYPYPENAGPTHAVVVTRDITAQTEAEDRLRLTTDRLRRLTAQLIDLQEEERAGIARELHDEAGQALTALRLSLETAGRYLPPEPEAVRQGVVEAIGIAEVTMENLRRIAHRLHPPGLDSLGLGPTLEGLCRTMSRQGEIEIEFRAGSVPKASREVGLTLYRFAQEGLTNILKHARATRASLTLSFQNGKFSLVLEDQGRGFQAREVEQTGAGGLGLLGLEERIQGLGGVFTVRSVPGRGTRLEAVIPAGGLVR